MLLRVPLAKTFSGLEKVLKVCFKTQHLLLLISYNIFDAAKTKNAKYISHCYIFMIQYSMLKRLDDRNGNLRYNYSSQQQEGYHSDKSFSQHFLR